MGMRLLLTSGGLCNPSISKALRGLVEKRPEAARAAFIPTAANIQTGDKGWLIDDLVNLRAWGFGAIDIVDISALERRDWLPRLREADVLYFTGGSRYHLMARMLESGLGGVLPELLQSKVYVGMSAGSMVASRRLGLVFSHRLYHDDQERADDADGLGLVDFFVLPHLNNPFFPGVREPRIKEAVQGWPGAVYALDDSSAVLVSDGEVSVVSEGSWKLYVPGSLSGRAA